MDSNIKKCKVTFLPDNKEIEVDCGTTILAASISAGAPINSSCGGDGVCGRCKIIIIAGEVHSQPTGRISLEERGKGYCLACLATIQSNAVVEIPEGSRLELGKISAEEAYFQRLQGLYAQAEDIEIVAPVQEKIFVHSALATKLFLELPPPNLDDKISDLERLYRQIRRIQDIPIMQTGLSNVRRLGRLLRSSDWKVTVTLGKRNGTAEIVLIEPGDTSARNFGIAFDIGTTTISGQLVNLNTKQVLGAKAIYNRQASFGSDVISRIVFAQAEDGLERLHHAVIDGMNGIIQELIKEHRADLNDVTACVCAGNPTMVHLLLRVDPTYIRKEPYVPAANFVPVIRAAEAGIKINPRGLLSCVPGVASYVGGDVTAGVLACRMADSRQLSLLIDIGTNGEIILGSKDWMISCAASAGPAFEGSGVSCGMRASRGAIQKVAISCTPASVQIETIGNEKPRGICGSGYISLLADLWRCRIMERNGRFSREGRHPRLRQTPEGVEFVVVAEGEGGAEQDIVITEMDIDNLKRSKAAIYAATSCLVRHMGLDFKKVQRIFIAGGFGTFLDIEKAIAIGLLPDLPREKFIFVGNSSLEGAQEILLSYQATKQAEEIARKITYFELSVDPGYMDEYMAALFFPHTDKSRFPSVA